MSAGAAASDFVTRLKKLDCCAVSDSSRQAASAGRRHGAGPAVGGRDGLRGAF